MIPKLNKEAMCIMQVHRKFIVMLNLRFALNFQKNLTTTNLLG